MSFIDGRGVRLFPLKWIKDCIKTYTKSHGKAPKILVVSSEDYIDYCMSQSMGFFGLPLAMSPTQYAKDNKLVASLGLEMITSGDYLKVGEVDFAMAIKDKNETEKE